MHVLCTINIVEYDVMPRTVIWRKNPTCSLRYVCVCVQADAGGLVSPGGLSYVGRSKEILGDIPGAVAIKRMDLDEALAKEAQR